MFLLVVLSTAALFCPTLSQPTRSDVFDEGDYPMPVYRDRSEWGEAVERPYKGIDAGNLLRDLEALRQYPLYSHPRRNSQFVEPLGLQLLKASRKLGGLRFADKRNFDEIDRSGFNGFIKKNFDEIDRSGFNSLVKKNFDEIDRSAFNGFVKRSANDFDPQNH